MIKVVMGVVMVIVLFSRGLMIPVYLAQPEVIRPVGEVTATVLKTTSFAFMVLALVAGALIILRALWQGRQAPLARPATLEEAGISD